MIYQLSVALMAVCAPLAASAQAQVGSSTVSTRSVAGLLNTRHLLAKKVTRGFAEEEDDDMNMDKKKYYAEPVEDDEVEVEVIDDEVVDAEEVEVLEDEVEMMDEEEKKLAMDNMRMKMEEKKMKKKMKKMKKDMDAEKAAEEEEEMEIEAEEEEIMMMAEMGHDAYPMGMSGMYGDEVEVDIEEVEAEPVEKEEESADEEKEEETPPSTPPPSSGRCGDKTSSGKWLVCGPPAGKSEIRYGNGFKFEDKPDGIVITASKCTIEEFAGGFDGFWSDDAGDNHEEELAEATKQMLCTRSTSKATEFLQELRKKTNPVNLDHGKSSDRKAADGVRPSNMGKASGVCTSMIEIIKC